MTYDRGIKKRRTLDRELYEQRAKDIMIMKKENEKLRYKLNIARDVLYEVDTILAFVPIKFRIKGQKIIRDLLKEIEK